jgi:hypothetical protein
MVTYAALPQNAGPLFALGAVSDHELDLLVCQVILQKSQDTCSRQVYMAARPLFLYREKRREKKGGEGARADSRL